MNDLEAERRGYDERLLELKVRHLAICSTPSIQLRLTQPN